MFERSIRLAASKAATQDEQDALAPVIVLAHELDEQERGFEARIEASKAARGEGPVRLSRSKREEVDRYAADAAEMAAQQLEVYETLGASGIVFALHMGLDSDVAFWSKAHLKAHPSDAAIVKAFADAKARLRDALAAHLERYPGEEA